MLDYIKYKMGGVLAKIIFKSGVDKIKKNEVIPELWENKINDLDGNPRVLKEYTVNKKAFIFVNVACK
jgi:hypothetical protein